MVLLTDSSLPRMQKLMASIGQIVNDCLEDWLEEVVMIPRKQFKDISHHGYVSMNRRRHDFGNYKYSVMFLLMTRLAPHHQQQNITCKLMHQYESLSKPSSTTDTCIELIGDVIEYCLYFAVETGPAIPDDVRESRLSFNKAITEFVMTHTMA